MTSPSWTLLSTKGDILDRIDPVQKVGQNLLMAYLPCSSSKEPVNWRALERLKDPTKEQESGS